MFVYEEYAKLADYLIPMCNENVCYRPHLHACLEVHICLQGQVAVEIAGATCVIGENQGVVIPPYTVHSYHTPAVSQSRTILISQKLIPDFANLLQQHRPSRYSFPVEAPLRRQLLAFYDSDQTYFAGKALLYSIFDAFLSDNTLHRQSDADAALPMRLLTCMQEHFREEFTLEDLAARLDYSYYYISKVLHRHFGLSFTELLAEFRISFARQLLDQRRFSISEVALQAGFGSIRSFNRVFRQLTGMTPSRYLQHPERLINTVPADVSGGLLP